MHINVDDIVPWSASIISCLNCEFIINVLGLLFWMRRVVGFYSIANQLHCKESNPKSVNKAKPTFDWLINQLDWTRSALGQFCLNCFYLLLYNFFLKCLKKQHFKKFLFWRQFHQRFKCTFFVRNFGAKAKT